MELDDYTKSFYEIFCPEILAEMRHMEHSSIRFAYYTNAETAMKIIENEELWLRNVTVMNDYSEIYYGLDLVGRTMDGPIGARFREVVDDIFPGTINKAIQMIGAWRADWEHETYIACVSKHKASEDQSGRLSMWRAYGDVALVVNNTPFAQVTDLLAVYGIPVAYLSKEKYEEQLDAVTDRILTNRKTLQAHGPDALSLSLKHMFFNIAIATKHPGFAEEQEWRIFYRPNEARGKIIEERTVVLNGVPQTIFVLPLRHDPLNGLFRADIPSLLDRLIVGPTEHPYVATQAFRSSLRKLKVANAAEKVFYSDIPLRSK